MRKSQFLKDISLSSAQAVLNQLSGIVVFFIISRYLNKSGLGQINWALAVLTVSFSVLGLGLEHIAVRKTAKGTDTTGLLQTYLTHVYITGTVFLGLVWMVQYYVPGLRNNGNWFILLALGQSFSFFASPFRQIANGLEKFRAFFIMSSCANLVKILLLPVLAFSGRLSFTGIIDIYLLASFTEWLVSMLISYFEFRLPVFARLNRKQYAALIKESLPQLGITVFNTAVQRMDWILLGFMSTAVTVAEYSFTNKLFDLCMLPLLMAAPVIFPRIAKSFSDKTGGPLPTHLEQLTILMRIEILVSVLVALLVNIGWTDIIDWLTDHKYGVSTRELIFIMSFAIPLVYLNNIFWSILFSQERMKELLLIFFIGFCVNMLADAILIHLYQAKGAASGFLLALCVQTVLYLKQIEVPAIRTHFFRLIPAVTAALLAGTMAGIICKILIWQMMLAVVLYMLLLMLMKQWHLSDRHLAKRFLFDKTE